MAKKKIGNYKFKPGIGYTENIFPNAYALLNTNKAFLQAETGQFITERVSDATAFQTDIISLIDDLEQEMVLGTIDKYDWLQLGAGINHVEHGKYVDCSLDAQQRTGVKDADLKIIPYNGYGDIGMIRKILKDMKPQMIF